MVETANSYEYAMFYNQMIANDTPAGEKPVKTFSDGVIQKFRDGSDPIRFPSINWIDYIMGDATLQSQHNLNISEVRIRYVILSQQVLIRKADFSMSLVCLMVSVINIAVSITEVI